MREVLRAAAAIATKQSPVIICVSKNQAWVNPSSSARCANFHESLAVAIPIPKSMATHSSLMRPRRELYAARRPGRGRVIPLLHHYPVDTELEAMLGAPQRYARLRRRGAADSEAVPGFRS